MGSKTKIEWSESTWTPIRARNKATGKVGWHCTHVTEGCSHCYSESLNKRLGTGLPFKPGHEKNIELFLDERLLIDPLRWKKPRRIFVCSMTDLFADFVPDEWIDRVFAVMALAPQHTFQVLTKRSKRMREYCSMTGDMTGTDIAKRLAFASADAGLFNRVPPFVEWLLPNVWLGVSAEDQTRADERIPDLLATPAAVRFVSAEPLLGPVDLTGIEAQASGSLRGGDFSYPKRINSLTGMAGHYPGAIFYPNSHQVNRLDWIIVGGESGPGARLMQPDWARSIRDQCASASVPFFMKQMTKKGLIPEDLMIREFPGR